MLASNARWRFGFRRNAPQCAEILSTVWARFGCTLAGRNRHEVCSDVAMGVKKQRTLALDPNPAWRSPVQQELDGLFGELAAFNERIAELVKHGHRSHAMTVLKAQALSLASQIDELRGLLAAPRTPTRNNRPI
jgi:hypothetical protein